MSNAATEEVADRTQQDPVNISVYGNPVLDVIVNVAEGSGHVAERDAVEEVAKIHHNGDLAFKPDSYICFYLQGEPILWGPFNPAGQQEVYAVGKKHRIRTHSGPGVAKLMSGFLISILPGPAQHIGGGGANVLFGFYDVFARLKVELIATVEQKSTQGRGRLDPFLVPLIRKIGQCTEIPLYSHPGVNLAIEGLGPTKDRTIFTAQLPIDEEPLQTLPVPRGKAVMVNTVYSPQVAIDALAHASSPDRLGILALTTSLCSERPVPEEVFSRVFSGHPHLAGLNGQFKSIKQFVCEFVLPRGHCILVLNEDELTDLTNVPFSSPPTHGISETALPTLGGVVEGLRKIRQFQDNAHHRVYVTVGPAGSIVLTENDELIACGVSEVQNRLKIGKTAIGDTYATFLLALETIGNYIAPYILAGQDIVKAAAAGADSGVYDGFGNIAVHKVNGFMGDPGRRLLSLGSLRTFDAAAWRDLPILNMRDTHWDAVSRRSYHDAEGPGTLQEVLSRAFLRLPTGVAKRT